MLSGSQRPESRSSLSNLQPLSVQHPSSKMSQPEENASDNKQSSKVVKGIKKQGDDLRGNSVRPEQTDQPPKGPAPQPPRAATKSSNGSKGSSSESDAAD